MKTLDQVQPRTPIGSLPYTISTPGSYYLTGNVAVTNGKSGISIQSDNVTVDLGGFTLTGNVTNTATGIIVPGTAGIRKNICIQNGTVRAWGNGGVRADSARNSHLENLWASDNSGDVTTGAAGIVVGEGSSAKNYAASANNCLGIHGGNGSSILDCTAWANSAAGFFLDDGATLSRCTAKGNTADGIQADDYCTIVHCTTIGNHGSGINVNLGDNVIDCAASANNSDGILAQQGSTVRGCNTVSNGWSGIEVTGACHVTGNTSDNNNHAMSTYAGINATGAGNVIRANNCTNNISGGFGIKVGSKSVVESNSLDGNSNGILVNGTRNRIEANRASCHSAGQAFILSGANNLIIRNSARDNGTNQYQLNVSGNSYGPIINVAGVGDISGTANANHPLANFVY